MKNQIFIASVQPQSIEQQASSPMQVLTLDEMRSVVGGPIIHNGGTVVSTGGPEIKNGGA